MFAVVIIAAIELGALYAVVVVASHTKRSGSHGFQDALSFKNTCSSTFFLVKIS